MEISQTAKAETTSLTRDVLRAARYHLGNWRALLIIAFVASVVGVALNWSWLVAAGIAPILLSSLPCLVMCGLGLCMTKMVGGESTSQPSSPDQADPTRPSDLAQAAPKNRGSLTHVSSCCGVAGVNNSSDKPKT